MKKVRAIALGVVIGAAVLAHTVSAQHQPPQHHSRPPHSAQHRRAQPAPTQAGQDAFAAIAEVVRLLDADPKTDWARVSLERLRQHLVDMNEVVLHSDVNAREAPGGLVMDVTGTGRTEPAIRALVVPHAAALDRMPTLAATTEAIPARIRGLGFAGLLTLGGHHGPHHLAMAKGEMPAALQRRH